MYFLVGSGIEHTASAILMISGLLVLAYLVFYFLKSRWTSK